MLVVTPTQTIGRLGSLTVAATLLLSACAAAPGMRMKTSSSQVQTTAADFAYPANAPGVAAGAMVANDGAGATRASDPAAQEDLSKAGGKVDATAGTPEIPLTELDIALVKRMSELQRQKQLEQAQLLSGAPQAYTVGPGDVLQIVVWDHPEIAAALGSAQTQSSSRPADPMSGFVVDQSGKLTFPYAGTLQVAGLRVEEVQQRVTAALAKYLVKPQVTVRMASYRAHQVYVDGEVHSPGVLAVNDVPMTFYEAISRAGGFSDTADQSDIVLVRDGVSRRVNLTRMLAEGLSPSQLYLKPGDLLRVVSRDENTVYVMGEVNKPISAIPRRTGRITLADALSQAGSVNSSTADAAQMFVIRGSLTEAPQVFHLDGSSPVAMLIAKEFDLEPKDVVYVDGSGLVRFNRVLSLLMPLVNAGLTAGVVAK
uniref:polysaccharide biosynthesis/export family protein n=1 Tax=Paraburkholderia agricolaris TaxID=2152888 RepID=UPI0038BB10CD